MRALELLDLFCGAGGCSVGYARAGFNVTGVDLEHHDGYPDSSLSFLPHGLDVECRFIQADAMDVLADDDFLDRFHVIAASPPCPAYSTITGADRDRHPRLIAPVREALQRWKENRLGLRAYVIENVEGAAPDMPGAYRYCGSSFGLRVRRHRLFESNFWLSAPACDHPSQGEPLGVYGGHPESGGGRFPRPRTGTSRGVRASTLQEARDAMGIPWMAWEDLTDAIPPAYTEHIGRQLHVQLRGGQHG